MLKQLRKFLTDAEPTISRNSDKRQHQRHSVLLQATLYPIDVHCDAIVHDVSDGGVMGESEISLTIGQVVHLTISGSTMTGAVRWTRGNRFGLALIGSGGVWTTLSDLEHGTLEGQRPRSQRLRTSVAAQLRTGRPPRPVTVRNLSQRGMLLDSAEILESGQAVLVHFSKRELIAGVVQWSNAGRVGVRSNEPIGILSIVYSEVQLGQSTVQ